MHAYITLMTLAIALAGKQERRPSLSRRDGHNQLIPVYDPSVHHSPSRLRYEAVSPRESRSPRREGSRTEFAVDALPNFHREEMLTPEEGIRVTVEGLSLMTGMENLAYSAAFRRQFIDTIKEAPFESVCFRFPPLSAATRATPFRYEVVKKPLTPKADPFKFRNRFEEFAGSRQQVIEFPNPKQTALLVVPVELPVEDRNSYSHIKAFLLGSPDHQQHELISRTFQRALEKMRSQEVWVSTSGDQVPWLHVRLDMKEYREPGGLAATTIQRHLRGHRARRSMDKLINA